MNLRSLAAGVVVMLAITLIWTSIGLIKAAMAPSPLYIDIQDRDQVALGRNLYVSHCAACHGVNLEGQPNWRTRGRNGRLPAPPHDETGHTWHHPDAVLLDIIRHGMVPGRTAPEGYASDMPAYAEVLTEDEMIAILAYIKSTWPDDILALQREATFASGQGDAGR